MKKISDFINHRPLWVSAIVFLLLALTLTYPLVFELSTSIYGQRSDNLSTVWHLWYWTQYAPAAGSDAGLVLNYPVGTNLEFRSTEWLSLGPTLLLAFITNEVVAFNLTVILSFFLSGWLMFLLLRKFTQSWAAPLLGGFVLMALPYHLAMSAYHFSLMRIEVFPLLLLTLYQFDQKQSWKEFLFVTLALAACAYMNPHYGVFAAIIIAIYFLVFWTSRRSWQSILQGLAIFGLFLIATLPLYFDVSDRSAEADLLEARPFSQLFQYAARPVAYVVPYLSGAAWYQDALSNLPMGLWHEQALFLGYLPILLALFGIVYLWKTSRTYLSLMLLIGFVGFLFSLPPTINVFGADVPMPANFLYSFLPLVRTLSRFGLLVGLATAVLCGFGVHFLLKRLRQPALKPMIMAIAFLIVGFEFWGAVAAPRVATTTSPAYEWLKEQPDINAIAEYPLQAIPEFESHGELNLWQFYQDRLAQRIHQKPLFNGPAEGFFNSLKKELNRLDAPATAARLKWLGIETLLVHKDRLSATEVQYLDESGDFELLSDFESDAVYRIQADSIHFQGGQFRSPVNSNFERIQEFLNVVGDDLLIYGPYFSLQEGNYQAQARLNLIQGNPADLTVQVVSGNGAVVLHEQAVSGDMLEQDTFVIPLEFNVAAPGLENIEFRLYATQPVEADWLGVELSHSTNN